jgi:hypothetical protein
LGASLGPSVTGIRQTSSKTSFVSVMSKPLLSSFC